MRQTINFNYANEDYSFTFVPEQSDWWITLIDQDGTEFDIHYCEDYNEICVYLAEGKALIKHSIYNRKIK